MILYSGFRVRPQRSLGLALFLFALIPSIFGDYHWFSHNALFFALAALPVGLLAYKRFGVWVSLGVAFFVAQAAYMAVSPAKPYLEMGSMADIVLGKTNAQANLVGFAVIAFCVAASDKTRRVLLRSFAWLGILNSALMIVRFCFFPLWSVQFNRFEHVAYGVLNASSVDATFLAMLTPVILRFLPTPWAILPLVAVFLSQSNCGIFVCMAGTVVFYSKSPFKIAVGGAFVFVASYFWLGETFLNDSGRFNLWRLALSWWSENTLSYAFGMGAGSFYHLGALIMKQAGMNTQYVFIWVHNEWVQILFEQGVVGLGVALLILDHAYQNSKGSRFKLSLIVCVVLSMGAQMPLRYLLTAVYLGLVVCEVSRIGRIRRSDHCLL